MSNITASVTLADLQARCEELTKNAYAPSRRKVTTAIQSGYIPAIRFDVNRLAFRLDLLDEIAERLVKLGQRGAKK